MSMIQSIKNKILLKSFRDDEWKWRTFDKHYPTVKNFIWTIMAFIGSVYIFSNLIYNRIGFERTLIILMVAVAIYLRSWLKAVISEKR